MRLVTVQGVAGRKDLEMEWEAAQARIVPSQTFASPLPAREVIGALQLLGVSKQRHPSVRVSERIPQSQRSVVSVKIARGRGADERILGVLVVIPPSLKSHVLVHQHVHRR